KAKAKSEELTAANVTDFMTGHFARSSPTHTFPGRSTGSPQTVHLDMGRTTLHWDGSPSEQKSAERQRRQEALDRKLEKLEGDIVKVTKKGSVPARLNKECRRQFRSQEILDSIKAELVKLGWNISDRSYKRRFRFDGVRRYPYEWTVFQKSELLRILDLSTDRHLVLASLFAHNDHYEGVRRMGINRNAAIVRKMMLDPSMELEQVPSMKHGARMQRRLVSRMTALANINEEAPKRKPKSAAQQPQPQQPQQPATTAFATPFAATPTTAIAAAQFQQLSLPQVE
ncbi:hypothetical protein BGZ65_010400, partial [Modicella reniformis]